MADLRDCAPYNEIFDRLDGIERKLDQVQRALDALDRQTAARMVQPPAEDPGRQRTRMLLPDDFMSRSEAAGYLQLSAKTLANWATKGLGPKVTKVGSGAIRYKVSDLQLYLESVNKS